MDLLAVSIDGYDKEHPSFIRDKGIFDKIINTVESAKRAGLEVSIVPTLHKLNYKAMKLYNKLAEELQVDINFSILTVSCNEIFKEYMLDDETLKYVAEEIFELNAEVMDMRTAGEGLCAVKSCGLGKNMISVDSKGNLYPCHILHDSRLLMGNIFEKPLQKQSLNLEVMNMCKDANVDNIKECKVCEYRYLCGGGCRARAFLVDNDLNAKDSYCSLFYHFHKMEMKTILQGIQDEKN